MTEPRQPDTDPRDAEASGRRGVFGSFREAIGETIEEARERGDLSTDRAREKLRGAWKRAREASADARERFDFVSKEEFDRLRRRVEELERRMDGTFKNP